LPGLNQIETKTLPSDGKIHRSQKLTRTLNKVIAFTGRASRKNFFYPSSLKLECKQALWFQYHQVTAKGEPLPLQEVDAKLARVFSTGNSFEDRFIKYLKDAKLYLDDEESFRVTDPIPISGRLDFIIDFKDEIAVVELKTINARGFDKLFEPKPEHMMQVQSYLNCTKYTNAYLVYENKDDQSWKEFYIEKDEELWGEMVAMCQEVMSLAKLPDEWRCTGPPWCVCKGAKL